MGRHLVIPSGTLICFVFLCGCQVRETQVIDTDGVTRIVINGQTIELKETAKEVVRKTFPTKAAPRVLVSTFNGKVTVAAAGADGTVQAEVTKTCGGETQKEAKAFLKLIDVQMKQDGDTIRIAVRRTNEAKGLPGNPTREGLKKQFAVRGADAVVRVPAGAVLELKTAYGEVQATGIAGGVTAATKSGAVTVKGGSGEVKVTSDYGNLTIDGHNTAVTAATKSGNVHVKGAKGPLDISSGYGTLTVTGAAKKVIAHSKSGNITVTGAKGPVRAESGYGSITVDGAAAVDVETRSGNVAIKGATGAVRAKSGYGQLVVRQAPAGATLETASGNIEVRAAKGAVKLTSNYGQIDAEVVRAAVTAWTRSGNVQIRGRLSAGESTVHSGYGTITLTLPADSRFRLDARTKYGRVTTDFRLRSSGKKEANHLAGEVGEDPKVVLKVTADSGNIEVRKE